MPVKMQPSPTTCYLLPIICHLYLKKQNYANQKKRIPQNKFAGYGFNAYAQFFKSDDAG